MSDYLVIAKFGKTHGLDGSIRVLPFSDDWDKFLSYDFFLKKGEEYSPIKVSSSNTRGSKEFILMKFDGITDVDGANLLVNSSLYIKRSQLPSLPDGKFYFYELIGMKVFLDVQKSITPVESTEDELLLGTITQVKKNFNEDLLIVEPTDGGLLKSRIFIPFRYGETVFEVNKEKAKLLTSWYFV